MRSTFFIKCLLPAIGLLIGCTTAAVDIDPDKIVPIEPTDNCLNIFDFDLRWFGTNACTRPQPNKCLFYGPGLTKTARDYAKANGLISIWDIWSEAFYSLVNVKSNTMRCIMSQKAERLLFFEWMSRGMALLCTGDVLYMTSDPADPSNCGFFGRFEYPTMQQTGKVTSFISIDPNGGQRTPFPPNFNEPDGPAPANGRRSAQDLLLDMPYPPLNASDIDEILEQLEQYKVEKRAVFEPHPPPDRCNEIIGAAPDVPANTDEGGTNPVPW